MNKHEPDSREWWQAVAQALAFDYHQLRESVRCVSAGMSQVLSIDPPILWQTTDDFMRSVAYWRDALSQASERPTNEEDAVVRTEGTHP